MDTKVTTQSRNVNLYAENITRQTLLLTTPFTLPCVVTPDGYPDLTLLELDKVPIKGPEWFLNLGGQAVFIASQDGENGQVMIDSVEHGRELHNFQEHGAKYLTLVERLKQVMGTSYYDHQYQEPEAGRHYTYNTYVNGKLQEQKPVKYLGLTDCLRWYIFRFTDSPDQEGNQHHLLPVGEFPRFRKQTAPGQLHFETYTSLLTLVK